MAWKRAMVRAARAMAMARAAGNNEGVRVEEGDKDKEGDGDGDVGGGWRVMKRAMATASGAMAMVAEAMAMGKPVIATNYSANLDFMDDSNSLLVEAEIITTERSYGVYPKGTRWANPNLDKAGELMKILCKQSLREKYSQVAKNSIKDKLSPDAIGFSVKKLLQKV